MNVRAIQMVVTAVAHYPQAPQAMTVLADRLLESFDSRPLSHPRIGIAEMARMVVDPEPTASRINTIHKVFGIQREVSGAEAAGIVTGIAFGALERLRVATVALSLGRVALPEAIIEQRIIIPGVQQDPTSAASCRREGADMLHAALVEHVLVRKEVARMARYYARILRTDRRNHRATVVNDYREKLQMLEELRAEMGLD